MERVLPDIGTIDEAKKKMQDSYLSFLDVAAKFISLCQYYSEDVNKRRSLGGNFRESYLKNYQKLKEDSKDDFAYDLSIFTVLELDYVNDVIDNLAQFEEIKKGQDPSLSDYDRTCDLLAVRDGFVDLERELTKINKKIATDRDIETHYNDKKYDPQLNQ